jgi:dihydropyrimidinase
MSVLIKGGRIITARDDYVADVLIEGETIAAVGTLLASSADRCSRSRRSISTRT